MNTHTNMQLQILQNQPCFFVSLLLSQSLSLQLSHPPPLFYSSLFNSLIFAVLYLQIHKFDKINPILNGVFHHNGLEVISSSEIWDLRTFHLLRTVPVLNLCDVVFNQTSDVIFGITVGDLLDQTQQSGFETSFKTVDASDYSSIGKRVSVGTVLVYILSHSFPSHTHSPFCVRSLSPIHSHCLTLFLWLCLLFVLSLIISRVLPLFYTLTHPLFLIHTHSLGPFSLQRSLSFTRLYLSLTHSHS